MAMNWADWSWLMINFLVLTPIGLYFTIKYLHRYKRGDNIISLRLPRLVLCTLFASVYYISIHQSTFILLLAYIDSYKWQFIFDTIGYQIVFILYFWRAWHQYFSYQNGRIKADHIWKSVINENYDHIQYETKIFIKYGEKLGNPSFTIYIIMIYILIYSLVIIFTTTLFNSFIMAQYIAFIDLIIIIIPFIFLFINISSVYDTIYVHKEILIQSIIILIFLLLEILIIFISNISFIFRNQHIQLLLESIFPSICFFINILISTLYVFHRQIVENKQYQNYKTSITKNNNENKHGSNSLPSSITLFSKLSHSVTSTNTNNNSITLSSKHNILAAYCGHIDLVKLLQQKEGFKLFVDHCVKEYALENLLCIIELNQFKKYCIQYINEDADGIEKKREFLSDLIDFYPTIPQSKIVLNTEGNLKDKFIFLYEKYIDSGKASWEVNIAALSRKHLLAQYIRLNNQKMQDEENKLSNERKRSVHSSSSRLEYDSISNKEIYQIITSFNGAIKDVIKCLNDSYSRFHVTKEYKKWHQQYVINGKLKNIKNDDKSSKIKPKIVPDMLSINDENEDKKDDNIELQIIQ